MTRRRARCSAADWPPDLVLLDDEDGADIFAVMEFGGEARPRLVRSVRYRTACLSGAAVGNSVRIGAVQSNTLRVQR